MGERASWPNGHKLVDRFRIIKQLAETACSLIYLAEDMHRSDNPKVVVKRLKPDKLQDDNVCRRFEREVDVLHRVKSDNVLSVYRDEVAGPDRYFITEFADKGTLQEYLRSTPDGKLSPIEALDIALSVCRGLEAAHRKGFIHRDVKPGNIFLFSRKSGEVVAKLGDFSVSHVPEDQASSQLTEVGSFIGTILYASPEQLGGGIADRRSDIYSWAIVFFEMLTGKSPTETDSLRDPLCYTPASDRFEVSFFTQKGIPDKLAEVLQKNLSVDQNLRHQSIAELGRVLERIQSQIGPGIRQRLTTGEAHIRSAEWQAACGEFEQGLAWCGRPDHFDELGDPFRELASKLWMGRLCAQGMMHLTQRRWPQAVGALEELQRLDSDYLGLNIDEQLGKAQSELQLEQKYQHLLQLKEAGQWAEILRIARELTTGYRRSPEEETVGEIRKLALYARGQQLLEEGRLEEAYDQFYRLYERDRNYEDVAERCTTVAFMNAMREDIPASKEHQVAWLEKVIEIAPLHKEGRTRGQLVGAREALGDEKHGDKQYPEAIKHWKRALELTSGGKGTLRRKIGTARFRAYRKIFNIGLVLALIGIMLEVLQIWQPWREHGQNPPVATWVSITPTEMSTLATFAPTVTPSPDTLTLVALHTPTHTPPPTPTHTLTPTDTPWPTPTRTPAPTDTPWPTSTHTPVPTDTPVPTPTRTLMPTDTPVPTPTHTPTPPHPHTSTPLPAPAATRRWLLAPTLIAPDNKASFTGWNAEVILKWSTVEGMAQGEYYVVRIPYDSAGNVAEFWRNDTVFRVPSNYSLASVGFPDRHYDWSVQIMHCTSNCDRALDDGVTKQGTAVGDKSAERTFYWHPDIGGGQPSTDDTPDVPPPTPPS